MLIKMLSTRKLLINTKNLIIGYLFGEEYMQKQIILDEESFKVLSSDTRIKILKNLKLRRHTLSELSKNLSLKTSTIKEHCDVLRKAKLIEQIDEGRKWKYYELTENGKKIVAPKLYDDLQVLITLCATIIIFSGILFLFFGTTNKNITFEQSTISPEFILNNSEFKINTIESRPDDSILTINKELTPLLQIQNQALFSIQELIIIMSSSLLLGIFIGWISRKSFFK
jgi:DNA-binding transcriptional ArsR family regulator